MNAADDKVEELDKEKIMKLQLKQTCKLVLQHKQAGIYHIRRIPHKPYMLLFKGTTTDRIL